MADERIDILVTLRDLLSRPAKDVEESLDNIRDSADEAAESMDEMDAAQRRAARGATAAEREFRKLNKTQRQSAAHTVPAISMWERFTNRLQRGSRAVGNAWRHLNNMFHKFFTTWSLVQGLFTDMAAMLPIMATGLKSLSAMVIALIGPLVKMTGVLGQAVPLYLAFAQSAAVIVMGFKGIGKAVSAIRSGDIAAIAEATKDMGDNAFNFAAALAPIADRLGKIRKRVQETFLKGLDAPVTRLADRYLPRLNKGLWKTAHAARRGFHYFADVMGKPSNMRLFSRVMARGAKSTEKMGRIGTQFGVSIMKVADAAAPSLNRTLDTIGDKLAAWNTNKSQKGLRKFFDDAQETAVKFGTGLKNLFGGLGGVAKAAKPLTEFLTGGMASGLERFNEWANSDAGQEKMTKFFEDQIPNLQALGELFRVIRDEFGGNGDVRNQNFLDFIEVAKNDIVPAIADIFEALDKHVTPSMVKLAENSGIIDWEMAFKPLGQALDIASEVAGWLTETMDKFPPLRDIKSYLFGLQMIGAIPLALGLTRGAKNIFKRGGKNILGLGGAVAGSSIANPMYVWVLNEGLGGGKGGAPVVAGSKAGGKKGGKGGTRRSPGNGGAGTKKNRFGKLKGKGGLISLATAIGAGLLLDNADVEVDDKTEAMLTVAGMSGFAGTVGLAGLGLAAGMVGIPMAIAAPRYIAAQNYRDNFDRGFRPESQLYKDMVEEGRAHRASLGIPTPAEAKAMGMSVADYQRIFGAKATPKGVAAPDSMTLYRQWQSQRAPVPYIQPQPLGPLGNILHTPGKSGMPTPFVKGVNSPLMNMIEKSQKGELKMEVGANTTPAQAEIDTLINRNAEREITVKVRAATTVPVLQTPLGGMAAYADGGRVPAGQVALVGERGPEAFVSTTGSVGMIGLGGPEVRKFNEGGYVIPHEALAAARKPGSALGGPRGGSGDYAASEGLERALHLHFGGTNATPADIERAVARGLERARREEKERQ